MHFQWHFKSFPFGGCAPKPTNVQVCLSIDLVSSDRFLTLWGFNLLIIIKSTSYFVLSSDTISKLDGVLIKLILQDLLVNYNLIYKEIML